MSRLLREVKIRVAQGGDVSTVAESAREISQLLATISKDVGNALGCAPASLVAGTLVSVLETVQTVKTNKEDCIRLALRAAQFWVTLRDRMNGRWANAPPELVTDIERLQRILVATHHVMQRAALRGWADRFMHKSQIGGDIADHAKMVEDAIQSFHITTLLDLRLIAGDIPTHSLSIKEGFLKTCPPPSVNFTGRLDILTQLHKYFSGKSKRQRVFVLWGLGGGGKTQLMYKFVQECQIDAELSCFSEVFFVDSTTAETIDVHLKDIAQAKKCGGSAQDALAWLAGHHVDWLLLFNNADDTSLALRDYFPSCSHGNIIITSRNHQLCNLAPESNHQVSEMSPTDATNLLLRISMQGSCEKAHKSAKKIAKELGYLALALVQAGAYIAKSGCSLSAYYEMYQKHHLYLLNEYQDDVRKIDGYEETVYTTWRISFRQLSPLAVEFLQICAFLHHEGISEAIFRTSSKQRSLYKPIISSLDKEGAMANAFLERFQDTDGTWDSRLFLRIIAEVSSYSLMESNPHNQLLSIHPLVHAWCQTTIADGELTRRCTQYILRTSIIFKYESEDYAFRRTLLPHIDEVLKRQQILDSDFATGFSLVYRESGQWKNAEKLDVLVMKKTKQVLGEEHPDTLIAMGNLAATFCNQGQLKQAEGLQLVVIEMMKQVLGEEHPSTLKAIFNLAETLHLQGRWKEAEEFWLVVVAVRKRVLGEEHPDTLEAMGHLALTFHKQGRWKEAEKLDLIVMESSKQVLGEEHPHTLDAMGDLALTFNLQGRLKEAEELELEVMKAMKQVLGEEHPQTLTAMSNLAATFFKQGQLKKAEELQLMVMEVGKQVQGERHPDTLTKMGNLAAILIGQGRLKEAEELQLVVIEVRKQELGEEHPQTLITMGNLASTFREQGRLTEAEELQLGVVEVMTRVHGEEHPNTLRSTANMARIFLKQGRRKEAEELGLIVIETSKRVLGEEHRDTLKVIADLVLY